MLCQVYPESLQAGPFFLELGNWNNQVLERDTGDRLRVSIVLTAATVVLVLEMSGQLELVMARVLGFGIADYCS